MSDSSKPDSAASEPYELERNLADVFRAVCKVPGTISHVSYFFDDDGITFNLQIEGTKGELMIITARPGFPLGVYTDVDPGMVDPDILAYFERLDEEDRAAEGSE